MATIHDTLRTTKTRADRLKAVGTHVINVLDALRDLAPACVPVCEQLLTAVNVAATDYTTAIQRGLDRCRGVGRQRGDGTGDGPGAGPAQGDHAPTAA